MARVMCGKRAGSTYRDATLADPTTSGTNYGCPDGYNACSQGNPQTVCYPADDTFECPVLNITWVTDMNGDPDQFVIDQMNDYNRTVITNSFHKVLIDNVYYNQFFTFTTERTSIGNPIPGMLDVSISHLGEPWWEDVQQCKANLAACKVQGERRALSVALEPRCTSMWRYANSNKCVAHV